MSKVPSKSGLAAFKDCRPTERGPWESVPVCENAHSSVCVHFLSLSGLYCECVLISPMPLPPMQKETMLYDKWHLVSPFPTKKMAEITDFYTTILCVQFHRNCIFNNGHSANEAGVFVLPCAQLYLWRSGSRFRKRAAILRQMFIVGCRYDTFCCCKEHALCRMKW